VDKELVLKVILKKYFNIDPERVTTESRIEGDLGLDAVEESELQVLLEKEFKITFSPYECDNMVTVADYLFAIERQS
jgi:acyl carrier protein